MPSASIVQLTDDDLGRIVAFLKSLPAQEGPEAQAVTFGPLAYVMFSAPNFVPVAEEVESVRRGELRPPAATSAKGERGRYLARTICATCHGYDLGGDPIQGRPSLTITAAYSLADLTALLRTGIALGNRESTMTEVAIESLHHLTDSEISDLHVYLHDDLVPAGE